jgi:proton-coupled amino acid transporter
MAPANTSSPLQIPLADSDHSTPLGSSPGRDRAASIARLGSPIPVHHIGTPPVRQIPTPSQIAAEANQEGTSTIHSPLAITPKAVSPPAKGESALAQALRNSGTPPRFNSPAPVPGVSPSLHPSQGPRSNYGSFDQRNGGFLKDDLEIVKRHLAGPSALSSSPRNQTDVESIAPGLDADEFSSLRLQGGDVTRQVYRLVEQQQAEEHENRRRKSFTIDRPMPQDETLNIGTIKQPGGFRRDYIRRTVASPSPSDRIQHGESSSAAEARQPQILTTSFVEFLSLYGHFAGEALEDEEDDTDEYFSSEYGDAHDRGIDEAGENSALLGTPKRRRTKNDVKHGASTKGAVLLLLKSFVGTGVLFLPKAFLNGGMLFSSLVLLLVASLSYYCFILLVTTRIAVPASFGGMGFKLYGKPMRFLINMSLVLSQIGFASAYIVFVSENLQAFVLAVTDCKTLIPIKYMILMQMIIFLPLSLYRNIQNIQKIAVIADIFILLGLLYLYYFDIFTLSINHGVADIKLFNPADWTLFIGTAIFTFEGIGLIIPIQESMAQPKKFPGVLAFVMLVITIVFTSMGALSYAAFGSKTKTVVILNMPQDSKFVNAVQFIYSLAILLSTPLQFFPAIEITSQAIFKRKSGRANAGIKWTKNMFRFFMVVFCALIAWIGADDLDKFVALVGSFACIPLVYIYPVSFFNFTSKTILIMSSQCYIIKPFRKRGSSELLILL